MSITAFYKEASDKETPTNFQQSDTRWYVQRAAEPIETDPCYAFPELTGIANAQPF